MHSGRGIGLTRFPLGNLNVQVRSGVDVDAVRRLRHLDAADLVSRLQALSLRLLVTSRSRLGSIILRRLRIILRDLRLIGRVRAGGETRA